MYLSAAQDPDLIPTERRSEKDRRPNTRASSDFRCVKSPDRLLQRFAIVFTIKALVQLHISEYLFYERRAYASATYSM
jgi:hypothetical protein